MTVRARLAALTALLPIVAVVLAGCGDNDEPSAKDPNDKPSRSGKPTKKPSESPATPSASDSGSPATVAVPVYFVGDTPQGPRLFREFQQVEADNPVDEALAILTGDAADDPDYSSALGGATLRAGTTDEDMTVEVSGDVASRPSGMSAKRAKLAVQQVVFTVQGILQDRVPISFVTADGESTPLLGLSAPDGGFTPDQDVLALVNVTQPQQNSEPGDSFVASGVANSFEATVPWEVRDENGAVVLEGFATAEGWGDKLYPWTSQVDAGSLPPGTYTFVAKTDDPSGGEGGGPTEDSKTITVQ
jgi:Immunoglobulin-like domain of bacterial spore germination/Sporulation and spore germination